MPDPVRLNVGAGQSRIPGFVNVDISPRADISLDLGRDRLPFDDGAVELVFSYHTLEHVTDYLFALGEIHRVLRPGGKLLLGVPYVTLTEYNLVNPYHKHHFNEHSFSFFDPARLKGSAAENNPIRFARAFHRLHYMGLFNLVLPPLRGWCRRHLFNVVRKIDFGLVKVAPGADSPAIDPRRVRAMRKEFDDCLRARVPYDAGSRIAAPTGFGAARAWWHGRGF